MYRPNHPIVLLRSTNNPGRQRFTVAHEIGHLLIGRVRAAGRVTLDSQQEEKLCDEFATSLLLPSDEVATFLDERGGVASPRTVLEMASHFAVNIQPCALALNQAWTDGERILLVSEKRGHPRRPEEVDYRIAASAGMPFKLIPRHARLSSMGLASLSEWAAANTAGDGSGGCEAVEIPFWAPAGPARSGWIRGRSTWKASCLKNGLLIVLMDVSDAMISWSRAREVTGPDIAEP
jgi:hypothetical protein